MILVLNCASFVYVFGIPRGLSVFDFRKMSDEKPESKVVTDTMPAGSGSEAPAGAPMETAPVPEIVFDRVKNEVTFVGLDSQTFKLRARVIEEEPLEEYHREPLSPDEFRKALEAIDKLGLTWTADLVPNIKAKTPEAESALASEELQKLQDRYPDLPYEIHLAATYALTGNKGGAEAAGGDEWFEKKAEILNEIILADNNYRSEFFFKYAIKIPYLKDIDWEVVFKAFERGITRPLGVPYGVLALTLQDPFFTGNSPSVRKVTVAVDVNLVNELLTILNEVKSNLETAKRLTDLLTKQHLLEEQANHEPKPSLGP